MKLLAVILTFLFIILFIAVAVVGAAFRRHLRTHFPDIWQSLGAPSFLRNNSVRNWLRLERYLWTSRYRSLADSELDALARSNKMLAVLYWTSFVGMILVISLSS